MLTSSCIVSQSFEMPVYIESNQLDVYAAPVKTLNKINGIKELNPIKKQSISNGVTV